MRVFVSVKEKLSKIHLNGATRRAQPSGSELAQSTVKYEQSLQQEKNPVLFRVI